MMYFKRKMRRGISTALIAAMTVGNALTVSAAPVENGIIRPNCCRGMEQKPMEQNWCS